MNASSLTLREFSFAVVFQDPALILYCACSNIYTRRVLAGEFQIVNPWLLRDLVDRGLWDDAMKNTIIAHNGSIQNGESPGFSRTKAIC